MHGCTDTTTLSYVTLDQLRGLLRVRVDAAIYDADDGSDVTRSVLVVDSPQRGGENAVVAGRC